MDSNKASAGEAPWKHYSVLVVDDEPGMVSFLQRALVQRCGSVDAAGSVEQAAPMLQRRLYDLIVLDISLPGRSGIDWLHELRDEGYAGDVVLMTAYADLDTAIDALRAGAADFLLKPFSLAQMLNAIQRCFERSKLIRENFVLRREVSERTADVEGVVGQSDAMLAACERLKRIAPTPATVLLTGESGTGKEVAARALHRMSQRAAGPFVPVNCAAIAAELIESELFGHVKGAFTGAQKNREGLFYYARGGTLFLDEIGELPAPAQAKLLRVLEERRIRPVGSEQEIPVDVRVIAATNRELVEEVAAHRFRQDLYYRLQVVEVTLPPLRERPEDLPLLVEHFIGQLAPYLDVPRLELDDRTLARMAAYDWPGNVRELRNFVERSLILGWFDLGPEPKATALPAGHADESLESVEKRHILAVLAACDGNKSEAGRRLGVSRKTLDRKCHVWGVTETV
ncbi:sigma-54-dependent Fis family transcriptional regulator [Dechloromonas denitrificans]|uniref:sigma-54-dependent transcriptional regulator n=1 Tax=Dechloromonas denitrificans TaxID=281362 RepID=UPI001CF8EA66|nr:sigma-54 dependent transcriptional regulator [Dechloromonas denitrificans]UCV11354.1 sigma-54-dependent Fis family transcriptional regulator [Dechloromonas denitrificans]